MRVRRRDAVHNHAETRRRTLAVVGQDDVVVIPVGQIVRVSADRLAQGVAGKTDRPFALHLETKLRGVGVTQDIEHVVRGLLIAFHEQNSARVSR